MLKLKLQYFGYLMRRVDSLEKTDAGRDWGQEEKGTTEDEMAGWHHWFDGHESEGTPGVGDGQGGLACCDSWGGKDSDMTERLNWTELNISLWVTDGHITKSEPTWYRIVAEAPAQEQFLLFQERTLGTSPVVQWLRIHLLMQSMWVWALLGKPGGSDSKESACNAGDLGSIPGSGRSPGEGNGNPFQYSCLGNPMDRGAWRGTVHGGAESDTTEWLTHTPGNQNPTCLREAKPVSFNNGAHTFLGGPCSTIREACTLQRRPSTAKKQRENPEYILSLSSCCCRFVRLPWNHFADKTTMLGADKEPQVEMVPRGSSRVRT